jgi:hypothetical protein
MEETKIQFSPSEMELLCNKDVILTKNKALEKIRRLLENLQNGCQTYILNNSLLAKHEIFSIHPKISKGENYLGLPYLVLDYPRCFQQQHIFTVRTMFWWGNFYSTTLHISGRFKTAFIDRIKNSHHFLSNAGYYIGINPHPWVHHFEEGNYTRVSTLREKEFIQACEEQEHLKLAINISINSKDVKEKLSVNWMEMLTLCFD